MVLKESNIFTLPMTAKYTKIDMVGSLDIGFQQVPLVQNFWNIHSNVMDNLI